MEVLFPHTITKTTHKAKPMPTFGGKKEKKKRGRGGKNPTL